jgi:hypothetical protein
VVLRLEELEDRRVLSVAYLGGPMLRNVSVETVYYGDAWQSMPGLAQQARTLDQFVRDITNSTYMDMLSEYGVGRGSFRRHDDIGLAQPGGDAMTITDQSIRDMLDQNIADPNSPMTYPDANTLYVVFTAPNVAVDYAVNNNFVGYHSSFTDSRNEVVSYAVIPYPDAPSDVYNIDAFTPVLSHELAESVTDPTTPQAWFDTTVTDGEGEIGDLAEGNTGRLDGYLVQAEWSAVQQSAVLPYDATLVDGQAEVSLASEPVAMPANVSLVAYSVTHSREHYDDFVIAAYERYLGREPADSEVAGWASAMQNGLSDEQVEAGFIGSPEYIANHGGAGAGWVTGMYQDLLGRTPAQSEVAAWVNALNHGMSTTTVAYGFAASFERESMRVQSDYQTYLGRSASAAEVNAWANAFENGCSNESVVSGFIGSPEYFQAHYSNVNLWLEGLYQDVLNRPIDPAGLQGWDGVL